MVSVIGQRNRCSSWVVGCDSDDQTGFPKCWLGGQIRTCRTLHAQLLRAAGTGRARGDLHPRSETWRRALGEENGRGIAVVRRPAKTSAHPSSAEERKAIQDLGCRETFVLARLAAEADLFVDQTGMASFSSPDLGKRGQAVPTARRVRRADQADASAFEPLAPGDPVALWLVRYRRGPGPDFELGVGIHRRGIPCSDGSPGIDPSSLRNEKRTQGAGRGPAA